MKKCPDCKKKLDEKEFYINRRNKDGYSRLCMSCTKHPRNRQDDMSVCPECKEELLHAEDFYISGKNWGGPSRLCIKCTNKKRTEWLRGEADGKYGEMKPCPGCKTELDYEDFAEDSRYLDGCSEYRRICTTYFLFEEHGIDWDGYGELIKNRNRDKSKLGSMRAQVAFTGMMADGSFVKTMKELSEEAEERKKQEKNKKSSSSA